MALIDRLTSGRTYFDSNIFIYAFEDYPQYPDCGGILRGLVAGTLDGVTSEISLLEILPKPAQGRRLGLADVYLKTMVDAPGLILVPVSRNIILRAISLRAAARLNSLDAIHIATALATSCDMLVTNDLRLRAPPQMQVIYLHSLSS